MNVPSAKMQGSVELQVFVSLLDGIFVHHHNQVPLTVSAYSSFAFILLFLNWYLKFSTDQKSEIIQNKLRSELLSRNVSSRISSVLLVLRLVMSDPFTAG